MLRRLGPFNVVTATIAGVVGFLVGHRLGDAFSPSYAADMGQSDLAVVLGYLFGFVGFLAGLGALNYPVRRMLGHPPTLPPHGGGPGGLERYFRFSTDHKVVGWQYLVGIGFFFLFAGINAMLIRLELLTPDASVFPPDKYLEIVGLHGAMMMGTMTSSIVGAFGNYIVPLLIGARRSAFPRIEALSFWVLVAAEVMLITTVFGGVFQTGWTGYSPLSGQGTIGIDGYLCFFALVGLSMGLLGFSIATTVVSQRAPGMSWGRLPIFVWAVFITSVMMVLAAPVLTGGMLVTLLDRSIGTSFLLPSQGGSQYLYENLFWFFGHPEVYLLAIPGMGVLLQLLPVFTRKPLWGYRIAVGGMIGIAVMSFTVWQHHLFVSGMSADIRPFYILSTEAISIPTGLIFLSVIGTLWRAQIRLAVPMLFCLAWIFNFLIGGITGVTLADAASDTTSHGSFYVLAHFHYTIMGAFIFTFFAAIYYWVPKMTGLELNSRLGKVHFWLLFGAFNSTFLPLFVVGLMGMPRRVVTYDPAWQLLNVWASISAFVIGIAMLVFLVNVIWSLLFARVAAPSNPWDARSLEWRGSSPPAPHNFDEAPAVEHPHDYGTPVPSGAVAEGGQPA